MNAIRRTCYVFLKTPKEIKNPNINLAVEVDDCSKFLNLLSDMKDAAKRMVFNKFFIFGATEFFRYMTGSYVIQKIGYLMGNRKAQNLVVDCRLLNGLDARITAKVVLAAKHELPRFHADAKNVFWK